MQTGRQTDTLVVEVVRVVTFVSQTCSHRVIIDIYLFLLPFAQKRCIIVTRHQNVDTSSSAFLRCQWPFPTSQAQPALLVFPLSRRKRPYPKLYLQIEKEERMYCKCNITLEFFLWKKLLGRSIVSERMVNAVHYFVRDIKNKRVEYIFLLYFFEIYKYINII